MAARPHAKGNPHAPATPHDSAPANGWSHFHLILSSAGRSFLRAFVGALIPLSIGILAAPNLDQAYALGVAALIASFTAGINTLQEFVPQVTFGALFGPYGKIADSFTRAFLGSLIVLLPGVLNAPDLSTAKGLGTAAIIGAFTAGIRAIQGFLTKGDVPSPASGT